MWACQNLSTALPGAIGSCGYFASSVRKRLYSSSMRSANSRVQPSPSSGSISLNLTGPRSSPWMPSSFCRVLRRLSLNVMVALLSVVDDGLHAALQQRRRERFPRHGPGDEVALDLIAAEALQALHLLGGFHADGSGAHAEGAAQPDHRFGERRVVAVRRNAADERAVEVQGVEREHAELRKRRGPGAEAVERNPDAPALQLVQRLRHLRRIARQSAFGDVELQRH